MQVTNGKAPTSILKRPSPSYGPDTEAHHRRKGERRVRFREPETTVHGEKNTLGKRVTRHRRVKCHRREGAGFWRFLRREPVFPNWGFAASSPTPP